MKAIKGILPLVILALLAGGTFLILNNLNNNLSPTDTSANVPGACKKLGINFAWPGPIADAQIDKAKALNMGYTLEIATDPGQVWGIGLESFDHALDNGITPILRACVGDNCAFGNKSNPGDASTYVNFINQLADIVEHNRIIYVIAGPNEPLSEPWLGGTAGNVSQIAPKVAAFMNAVIDGVDRPNVRLLSPVFNTTHPEFGNFVQALKNNGARFQDLDGIAGNAYNLKGYSISETITGFVDRMRSAGFTTQDIYLTEIGMFESERNQNWTGTKVPHEQAKINLANEITKMKTDNQIKAYLLFDSFGTNPDPNFTYNHIQDNEYPAIIGTECIGSGATNTSTPSPTATTTVTATPSPTATQTVQEVITANPGFSYDFSSDLESIRWTVANEFTRSNGKLEASLQNDYKSVVLKPKIKGDFNLKIRIDSLTSSTTGGLTNLRLIGDQTSTSAFIGLINSTSSSNSINTNAIVNNTSIGAKFKSGIASNEVVVLRIERVGSRIKTFYRIGSGSFVNLGTYDFVNSDLKFQLELISPVSNQPQVNAVYDNLVLEPVPSITITPTTTFTAQACGLKDGNLDNKLNIIDYRDFSKLYGKSLCSGGPITTGCGSRDANGDGKLNIIDYRDFAKLYGKSCPN